MSGFNSIWGDLGSLPSDKTKVTADPEEDKPAGEGNPSEEETGGKPKGDDDTEDSNQPTPPTPPEEEENEEDDYEFTEDDVSKAYTILADQGVLELGDDDEFEATAEGFAGAVATSIRKGVAEKLANVPAAVRELYEHIESGKDVSEFKPSAQKSSWKGKDFSDSDIQVEALTEYYLGQGLSAEEAEDEVNDAIANDKLEVKAGRARKVLLNKEELAASKKAEKAEAAKKKAIQDAEAESKVLVETIDSMDEMAGFKLDDKKKKDFKDYLMKVDPKTGKTQLAINMADEERRLKIAFLDFVDYSKADLTDEVKAGLTKDRKKKLTRYSKKGSKNINSGVATTSKRANAKGLRNMPAMFNLPKEIED